MQTFSAAIDTLKKRCAEYESSLNRAQSSNTELKNAVDRIARALDDMKNLLSSNSKCGICCSRDVDTALLECGHTVCKVCASRALRAERCPFCRQAVKESMKVYL